MCLKKNLRALRRRYNIDFAVVNGEYASGVGLTPQQADIVLNYTISGLFSVYQSWFLNPQNISLEELSQTVGYLTIDGVTGYADHVGALKR